MVGSRTSSAWRWLRVGAIAFGASLILGGIVRQAAMAWSDRVERDATAAVVSRRDGDVQPPGGTDAHARLLGRLAAAPRPVPRRADPAHGTAAPPLAPPPVPEAPPAGQRDAGAPLFRDLEELNAHWLDEVPRAYLKALSAATDDSGSVPSPEMRAWLAEHDAAILRAQEAVLTWEGDDLRRALQDERLERPRIWFGQLAMTTGGHALLMTMAARAAVAATDGMQAEADRGCEALMRLQALQAMEVDGFGVAFPVGYVAVLRRVRPSNAPDWIALMDRAAGRDALLSIAGTWAFASPPKGPFRIMRSDSLVEVLHQRLPRPVRGVFDAVLVDPVVRTRWTMETRELLDARAESEGSGACLPPSDAAGSFATPSGTWTSAWRDATVRQADMLLTREVLRLSSDSIAIQPTASPCPDWWLRSQELGGGHQVRAEGVIRGAATLVRSPPPLDYTFRRADRQGSTRSNARGAASAAGLDSTVSR